MQFAPTANVRWVKTILRMSNYMSNNVWDEITYPFLNLNGCISMDL